MCTLCRPDQGGAGTYDCERSHSLRGVRALYTLSHQEQRVSSSTRPDPTRHRPRARLGLPVSQCLVLCVLCVQRCEKLALQLSSHRLSGPFQQPVSPLVSLMDQP